MVGGRVYWCFSCVFYSDVYYAPTIDCFYSKCHLPIMFGLNSGRIFGNHWGCHGNGSRHDIFPIRNPAEMGFIGNVLFFVYPFFKPTGKSPKSVQEKRGTFCHQEWFNVYGLSVDGWLFVCWFVGHCWMDKYLMPCYVAPVGWNLRWANASCFALHALCSDRQGSVKFSCLMLCESAISLKSFFLVLVGTMGKDE